MVREYSEKKVNYVTHMGDLLKQYKRMLFADVDNVKSQQMHDIRRGLRGKAVVLMGKNTLMRKIINDRAEAKDATKNDKVLAEVLKNDKTYNTINEKGALVQNLAIIFTNADYGEVLEVIKKNRIQAPARVGSVSPVDVVIPAGNTGLEPGVTSFFQALNINTKIVKGAVEIVTDKKVLGVGEKVDMSVAALLGKLNIKPFFYGLNTKFVYDSGNMFGAEILELNDDFFLGNMSRAIKNITCLSLATGTPTEASLPHDMTAAFKNLLSMCLGTNLTFDQYNGKAIVEAVKSGKSLGGGGAAAAAASPKAAAGKAAPKEDKKKAPEPEPEGDDDMGLGLFD